MKQRFYLGSLRDLAFRHQGISISRSAEAIRGAVQLEGSQSQARPAPRPQAPPLASTKSLDSCPPYSWSLLLALGRAIEVAALGFRSGVTQRHDRIGR
jgi:hypothetical protein